MRDKFIVVSTNVDTNTCCVFYVVYRSEVAKRLRKDSYGLVFGFNSFIALFVHTILTYGIVQGHFISVTVAQQVNQLNIYYVCVVWVNRQI